MRHGATDITRQLISGIPAGGRLAFRTLEEMSEQSDSRWQFFIESRYNYAGSGHPRIMYH